MVDGVGLKVFGGDGAGAEDCVVSDCDSGADPGGGGDPCALLDEDWLGDQVE